MFRMCVACSCGLGACRVNRKWNMRKLFLLVFLLSTISFVYLFTSKPTFVPKMRITLKARNFCPPRTSNLSRISGPDDLRAWGPKRNRNSAHLLLFAKSSFRTVADFLASARLKYKISSSGKNLPDLIKLSRGGVGKYYIIIFEDIRDYYYMDKWNREILDKYCKQFRASIIGFTPNGLDRVVDEPVMDLAKNLTSPFSISSHQSPTDLQVLNHTLLSLIKPNIVTNSGLTGGSGWATFSELADHIQPVVLATVKGVEAKASEVKPVAILEPGEGGNIHKLIIGGSNLNHWLVKLLLLDAIKFLSNEQITLPLTRYVLVDIDDIFVGISRLTKDDVLALVQSQARLAEYIRGFRYNLGFSGSYFLNGDEWEDEGDEELVKQRDSFTWFPHMWKHIQPHRFNNVSELVYRMELNKKFAGEAGLPVETQYSVAPHHSGVYPVHQQLYTAWKQVWNIEVTSTEEYPNLRPARRRRGFIHDGIAVLPRQTCGLYTKNLYYDEYPRGPEILESSLEGGELFLSLLTNPISIFMTHMPNYCCDRLAPYAFETVANFASCYTNLDLRTVSPRELAERYFHLFPEERLAVWGNPCQDKRHMEIMSSSQLCNRFPNFLVIGPQKTGTTALYTFLKLHPNLVSNRPSPDTFEEVQFFIDKNYRHGIDWYSDFFPEGSNSTTFLFEKSANYFDGDYVPLRAHKLLPEANIVSILIPPENRAYSWYQHMRAHSDPTAINYSFRQVITAGTDSPKPVLSLQSRCLEPGKYAQHLEKWLTFYRPNQVYILDGEEVKKSPVAVLNKLQRFLQIPYFDYSKSLVFDKKKGYYCQLVNGKKKCLGKGKGRVYPPMDEDTANWLNNYYRYHNEQLKKLLIRLGNPVPAWLSDKESTGA